MTRKHLLLIPLLLIGISSFSQNESNIIDTLNLKNDIVALNNKIINLLKKDSYLSKVSGLEIFHIFWLSHEDKLRKEDFLDHSFLNRLSPNYFTRKSLFRSKRYLVAHTLISDSLSRPLAKSDGRMIYHVAKYGTTYSKDDTDLLHIFNKRGLDFVFYITLTSGDTYFGIKGKDIYVLKQSKEGLKVYPLKEFVDCCWDKFVMHHDDTGLYVP